MGVHYKQCTETGDSTRRIKFSLELAVCPARSVLCFSQLPSFALFSAGVLISILPYCCAIELQVDTKAVMRPCRCSLFKALAVEKLLYPVNFRGVSLKCF